MDNMPIRRPTPAAGQPPRPEHRPVQAAQPRIDPEPLRPAPRTPHHKEPDSKRKFIIWGSIAAAVIVIAVIITCIIVAMSTPSKATGIDAIKYQAVFFTNGQVYFGKLQNFNDTYMKLTDVFYLQTKDTSSGSGNPQQTTKDTSSDVQLIKLGNEIHGPQDEMIISKDQLLFFENLKTDGKVAGSIEQYKKTNK